MIAAALSTVGGDTAISRMNKFTITALDSQINNYFLDARLASRSAIVIPAAF
jgi:hypothetical protein